MPTTPELVDDLPEGSSVTPQPEGTPNPESAPHAEISLPPASTATHEELAAPPAAPEKAEEPVKEEAAPEVHIPTLQADEPAQSVAATFDAAIAKDEAAAKEAEKSDLEKIREAIHNGLVEGLRQMGKLPEWLEHEIVKLGDYIHVEAEKLYE